jgi:hypothetical protein
MLTEWQCSSEKSYPANGGKVPTQDENIVACGYFPNVCDINQTRPDFRHNPYPDGLFCPVKGSRIKCMSGRLYLGANDLTIVGSPVGEGIPKFSKANPGIDWTYKYMTIDSYNKTQARRDGAIGNDECYTLELSTYMLVWSVQNDYTVGRVSHYRRSKFPVFCGDHHGYGSLSSLQSSIDLM